MNATAILFLLLPLAAASGWFLARRRQDGQERSGSHTLPPDYFRGLSYLLDEQHDKAIDIFIRMLEEDSETVELHMAVGNLFRNRGEVERAIRIHQNLVDRTTLSDEQRAEAMFELGKDYMRAGLLDGAENLFRELVEKGVYMTDSLTHLIDIYQQEKDWQKAIDAGFRLERAGDRSVRPMIAQHYCELAEEALGRGDAGQAQQMLDRARATWPQCVRASIIEGTMEMEAGSFQAALDSFRRIEQQDADYLPEVVPMLQECFRRLGRPEQMLEYLQGVVERHGGLGNILAQAEAICARGDGKGAAAVLLGHVRRHPSLRGAERFVELAARCNEPPDGKLLEDVREILNRLVQEEPDYLCHNCGFQGRVLHWQCPSCKSWGSVKPLHGVVQEQRADRRLSLVAQ